MLVAEPLLGDTVHNHRSTEPFRASQSLFDGFPVVTVNGPDVLQPEVFEQSLRSEHVFEASLDAVQRVVQRLADERGAPE
jgi:hypothetical protein